MERTGNTKLLHIGIASMCDINTFKDYLDSESKKKIATYENCAPAVNTLILGLLKQGHFITLFTKYPVDELLYLKGNNLKIYIIPSCRKYPWNYLNGVWIDAFNIKKVIAEHINNLDVLHAHWTYDFAWAAGKFSKKLPVFCTIRDWSTYIFSTVSLKDKITWIFRMSIDKMVFTNKKINFIANSPYVFQRVKKAYNLKIPIIPNPVKSSFIVNDRNYYPKKFRIISISQSNDKRKNIETLLYAFQKFNSIYPDSSLSLIGSPFVAENKKVEIWNSLNLLKNVNLLGAINHEKLIDILDSSSLLVHPSLEETFGNVLIEAMARRLPVLGGKDSGAVPYVLNYGTAGYLCDVKNFEDIVKKMCLIQEDDILKVRLINNASELIQEKYRDTKVVREHISLYISHINSAN